MKKIILILLVIILTNSCTSTKLEKEKNDDGESAPIQIVEKEKTIDKNVNGSNNKTKPSIAIITFNFEENDNVARILSSSACNSIDLNLKLTGRYNLKDLIIKENDYSLNNIKGISFTNEIDNMVYGNVFLEDGVYKIKYNIYNTKSDTITFEGSYILESVLDVFIASDNISEEVLKKLSDTPLKFGYLNVKSDISDITNYQLYINDLKISLSNNPIKVISGDYRFKIVDSANKVIFDNQIIVNENDNKVIEIIQNVSTSKTVAIGDKVYGGIIFYINKKGGGLVAAPSDHDFRMTWEEARKYCNNLVLNGYDDWNLPSQTNLNLMYQNIKTQGIGNFIDDNYWSGNAESDKSAWAQGFGLGYKMPLNKKTVARVRAIRKVEKF